MKQAAILAYSVFMLFVAVACYLRPSPDDFDRYVYEALIRSARQPIGEIYRVVKHESPRAEASAIMDSPEHLAQLEPLYAIRPLYIELARMPTKFGVAPAKAIDLVSAISLFLIAILAYFCTADCVFSALLVIASAIVILGRSGGPDALSSLVVVGGCMAVLRHRSFVGILLLMISIWIRTDNVLIVLAVLIWLLWGKELKRVHAAVLGLLAIASVQWINTLSGNYGWNVLLHYSFVGGKYPAQITSGISVVQYVRAFVLSAEPLLPQIAPYLLMGIVTWKLKSSERRFLFPVFAACVVHYLLFPSNEARYFAWACILTGLLFIRALKQNTITTVRLETPPQVGRAA